jgi:hypothetical protein
MIEMLNFLLDDAVEHREPKALEKDNSHETSQETFPTPFSAFRCDSHCLKEVINCSSSKTRN